jgi:DNA-binding GntR family transcriptional regulator
MGKGSIGSSWANVYEFLRDRIMNGTYGPGEKLNEREIAHLVNVSRTPTREALKVLEYEGFVTKITQKGVFVKKYSPEELDILQRMLIRLEGLAVKIAAPKLSKRDLMDLQKMTNDLRELVSKGNYNDYLRLNFEFHLYFPKKTGSGELLDSISQLRSRIFRFYRLNIMLVHNLGEYINDHQAIVDALTGKTEGKPETMMEKHIDRNRKSFLGFYRNLSTTDWQ